jgi:anti-sigma B factor antagonist
MSLPRLATETEDVEGIPVVKAFGEVDLYTVPEFDQALRDAMDRGAPAVIADLTGLSYLDSAGLSSLLCAYRKLAARNAVLYVVAAPKTPGVRRALEITRLTALMKVRDTVESALQELRVRAAA